MRAQEVGVRATSMNNQTNDGDLSLEKVAHKSPSEGRMWIIERI